MIDLINLSSLQERADLEEAEEEEREGITEGIEEETEGIEEVDIAQGEEVIVPEEEEVQEGTNMSKRENQETKIMMGLKKHDLKLNSGCLKDLKATEMIDSIMITGIEDTKMMGIINLIDRSIKERMIMLTIISKKNASSSTNLKNLSPPKYQLIKIDWINTIRTKQVQEEKRKGEILRRRLETRRPQIGLEPFNDRSTH